MRTGRLKATLKLNEDEKRELTSLAHRSRSAPALARRACTMSRGRVRPARLPTDKSSRWRCARWKAPRAGPRIGALARWPRPPGTVT
jgi:hypothetical protein